VRRRGGLERQRERIRDLIAADPSRSSRSIAVEVGCSPHTVIRQRERVQPHDDDGTADGVRACSGNGRPHPGSENLVPPAGPGNERATRHGAWSEQRVAPVRERHAAALRSQFDAVDERLLSVMAHRMAQYELLTAWLDEHGIVKGRGEVFPAAQFAERLARNFEQQFDRLAEIQRDARRVDPHEALEAHLAELTAANGGDA
jgi:hypothetical protein